MIIPQAEPNSTEVLQTLVDKVDAFYTSMATTIANPKYFKKVKKEQKYWMRWYKGTDPVRKRERKERKEFLKNLWSNLKSMSKSLGGILKSVYGNWFTKVLKFLLFMAIFDPKGTLLMSLLGFVLKMATTFINAIIPLLPGIVKTMINIVTEVFPKVWNMIVTALASILNTLFTTLAKEAKSGPLKWIFETLAKAFGKDGILTNFFKSLGKILIPLIFAIGLFAKALPFLTKAGSILKFLGGILWKIVGVFFPSLTAWITGVAIPAITAFLGSIAAFLGPILLIVGALALIYKFSDKIVGFFDTIGEWFMGLGAKMKVAMVVLGGALAILLGPIVLLVPVIYGLAKLFQSIKKVGFTKTMQKIWKGIKDLGKKIGRFLKQSVRNLWQGIKNFFSESLESLKGFFSSTWTSVKTLFSDIWVKIKETFSGAWDTISGIFTPVTNKFKEIAVQLSPIFKSLMKVLAPIGAKIRWLWDILKNGILRGFGNLAKAVKTIFGYFEMIASMSMKDLFSGAKRASFQATNDAAIKRDIDLGKVRAYMNKEIAYKALNAQERRAADLATRYGGRNEDAYRKAVIDKGYTRSIVKTIKTVDTSK